MLRPVVFALLLSIPLTTPAAQEPDSTEAADSLEARQEDLPLEPTRKLQYTAREGSWMSVDVSPDGSQIVFDLLGDLYVMPAAGGTARALTRGMAFDMQPRFSPDGERVVFVSDRGGGWNIWIVNVDLSDTVQITRGKNNGYQSPDWTPDGEYVVATRESGSPGKLWMYHVKGGSGLALVDEPSGLRVMGAAFGPDPRYIWVARRFGTWTYNAPMGQWDLAVYDRETGELTPRSNRWGGGVRPTPSPDGRWLVYGSRFVNETGLRIRDLRDGSERWLAYPVQRDEQESRASRDVLPGMAFTPDSRAVIAAYDGKIWRIPLDGDPVEIPFEARVDLDLGPRVDFAFPIPDSSTFIARQIRDAVPSPDGARLAFTVLDQLFVMDYPDGTPQAITDTLAPVHQPAWSPDGRDLVFVTATSDSGGHLVRIRADGRNRRQLTRRAAFYQQPAWSPDGERIVAIRGPARAFSDALQRGVPGGSEDLIWVPADGGDATVIVPVDFTAPHFTSNPDRIYAYAGSDDGIISFRWDGTDRTSHVRARGPRLPGASQPFNPSVMLMAPEGDKALVQVWYDLYVITVPYVGGDTPTISVANPSSSSVPVTQLTDIGGQFPVWSRDGRTVHWSAGNAHFVYDLDAAEAFADSVEAEGDGEGDGEGDEEGDEEGDGEGDEEGDEEGDDEYRPAETRIEVRVPRDIPQASVVLRGATVVTMRGDEVITNADLVIRNNRIVGVGAQGSVTVPAGARVIPVSGMTILPGYVDTHAHLRAAADIHRREIWSYAANLAYGVTTTRDPQTATTDVLTYEDLARAGRILAPRMYSTGPGVFRWEFISDAEEAKDKLRRYSDYYDTKTIKMYVAGNREQRQWIIAAARELVLMPTTEGALDYALDLTMAIDGYPGQEHNTPGFPFFEDVVKLYVEAGTAYTPTILVTYGGPWAENYWFAEHSPWDSEKLHRFTPVEDLRNRVLRRNAGWFHPTQHTMDRVAKLVTDIVRAGGTAGVGSHGQLQGLGYHWELWSIAMGGMTPHEALQVATIHGARALGLDEELGSIEPGKLADLVILERNPLENIRHTEAIRFVMKNGRLYDGNTLDEVYPRERAAGPFYWEGRDEPGR